jgi:putative nucleotidyltransferase with HDIG domain
MLTGRNRKDFDLSQGQSFFRALGLSKRRSEMKCPGQDMRYWKPGDIFNAKCPGCGATVEFFKDEVRRKCRCGHVVTNPKLDFGCAEWCPYAEQCIGAIPEEVKAKQKTERDNSYRERISLEMKKYFARNLKQINHAAKVAHYAERIMKREGGDPLVILGAAYLHDIGSPEAQEKAKDGEEDYERFQEIEGPPIAREILERLGIKEEATAEICEIIGRHHHPREEVVLNFQILFEADWLAKIEEGEFSQDQRKVRTIVEKSLRTEAGRQLAEELISTG